MPPKNKNKQNVKIKNKPRARSAPTQARSAQPHNALVANALRTLGGLAGGFVGGPYGAAVGTSLAGRLSEWIGSGDYERVSANSLMDRPVNFRGKANPIFTHTEYFGDLVSSGTANAGKLLTYPLNPGMSQTFPWLSNIAQNFQQYCIKGMIVSYTTTSATAIASSTNSNMGAIQMAIQYRAGGAIVVSNKRDMLAMDQCADGVVYKDLFLAVECEPGESPCVVKYVRGAALAATESLEDFDWGTLLIYSSGVQGTNVTLGELHVTYQIELLKPINTGSDLQYSNYAHYNIAQNGTGTRTIPSTTPVKVFDNIGLTIAVNSVTLPVGLEGNYMISVYDTSQNAGVFNQNPFTLTNATFFNAFASSTLTKFQNTWTAGGTGAVNVGFFQVIDPTLPVVVTFVDHTALTTLGLVDLIVTQVNGTPSPIFGL